MRVVVSVLSSLCLVVLQPTWTAAEPSVAVRGEGYVGYSNLDLGFTDADGFEGGGTASVSAVFGGLYLQTDVFGDSADYDDFEAETVGGSFRVGWRDAQRGSAGVVGAYDRVDLGGGAIDVGRAGFEGELFLDRVTLATDVGYVGIEDDSTGYVDAGLDYYPIDRAKLHLGGGVFDVEESDPFGVVAAGGELLVADFVSLFGRWEASFVESSIDVEQHSAVVGVRLYWGADPPSLIAYDREHFKRACSGYRVIGARIC